MNSKERVLATFAGRIPDRCPIDFLCTAEMATLLVEALGLPDVEALRRHVGADVRTVAPTVRIPHLGKYYRHIFVKQIAHETFLDTWGITWKRAKMESGDVFYDVIDSPLKNVTSAGEIADYPFPDPETEWDFSNIRTDALQHADFAIAGRTAAVFDDAWRLTGFEKMLLDMAIHPELAHAVLRKVCDYWLKFARLLLEAAGGAIDLMWTFDDLGTQNGLVASPDTNRRFIIPLIKERTDLFRRHGAWSVMHSCGAIAPIIGDLIDAGVEALNPIQPVADMDRPKLKQEFGDRLIFHGAIDQQRVLVSGTPGDVVRETKYCIDTLAPRGGYIIAASHAIEADIPVENVQAMFETAQEYGRY